MLFYLKPYIRVFGLGLIAFCLLTLLSTGISVVSPYVNGLFIDCISYGGLPQSVVKLAVLTIMLGLFSIVLSYISQLFTAKLKTKFSYELTVSLISHVQRAPLLVVQKLDPAYLTSRITGDVDVVLSFFLNNIVSFFLSILVALISLFILFQLNMTLFIVSLCCIPAYVTLYFALKGPLFKSRKKYIEIKNKFTAKITEQLNLVEEIKTEGNYEKSQGRIKSTFGNVFRLYLKAIRISTSFSSIDAIISLVFQSFNLIWGGLLVAKGELTIGQYTIINVYFSYVMSNLQYFLSLGQSYQESKASFDRIQELLDIEPENNGKDLLKDINQIQMEEVSFDYSNQEISEQDLLISNFDFLLEKGKLTCLIGDNGSGKSTLVNILLGLIQENVSGKICYDGKIINTIDMNEAKQNIISVIKQNPKYPKMSIREILSENDSDVDYVLKAENAMAKWGLKQFYYNDQFDLSASIDKEMSELSGGERQKIALLFAIMKEPDLLVLDEPSSAMDQKSVDYLIRFINEYKKQHLVLCITHSPALISISDNTIQIGKNLIIV